MLDRLPTEVLDLIIDVTKPSDFDSIALSCKALFIACRPRIARHNEYRAVFRHFRYTSSAQNTPSLLEGNGRHKTLCFENAFELFDHILDDPGVMRWTLTADLYSWAESTRPPPYYDARDKNSGEETMLCRIFKSTTAEQLSKSFVHTPTLQHLQLDWNAIWWTLMHEIYSMGKWQNSHATVHCPVADILVLTMLPNALAVRLPCPDPPLRIVEDLRRSIVQATRKAHEANTSSSLSKVQRIGYFQCDRICATQDSQLRLFLCLPRVKELVGYLDTVPGLPHTLICKLDTLLYRNITNTGIAVSGASASFTTRLFQQLTSLEVLRCVVDGGPPSAIRHFLEQLEKSTAEQLQELHLSDRGSVTTLGQMPRFSFAKYSKLKKLSIECGLLLISWKPPLNVSIDGNAWLKLIAHTALADLVSPKLSEIYLWSHEDVHIALTMHVLFYNISSTYNVVCPSLTLVTIGVDKVGAELASVKEQCDSLRAQLEATPITLRICGIDQYEDEIERADILRLREQA